MGKIKEDQRGVQGGSDRDSGKVREVQRGSGRFRERSERDLERFREDQSGSERGSGRIRER